MTLIFFRTTDREISNGTLVCQNLYCNQGIKCKPKKCKKINKNEILLIEKQANISVFFYQIPYDMMWADDVHWYPLMLADKKFKEGCS